MIMEWIKSYLDDRSAMNVPTFVPIPDDWPKKDRTEEFLKGFGLKLKLQDRRVMEPPKLKLIGSEKNE